MGVCVLAVVSATACAARSAQRPVAQAAPSSTASVAQNDSLETFMGKVRALSASSRPVNPSARTVEGADPALAAALLAAEVRPSAATRRALAVEYVRVGILDKAHEHFKAAVTIDHRDAAAWDGLARIWRDWGQPHLGLTDAHRAVYFAPESPVVHNTLGTLLQAMGRRKEARTSFMRALQLDAAAAYALNNLCYGWFLEGRVPEAIDACQRALNVQPGLQSARNNLALVYAVDGDLQAAADTFAASSDAGQAEFNMGIVHLARGAYGEAVKAFDAAQARRADFRAAKAHANEARRLASAAAAPKESGAP
jgi:Tfp pilus assembly protein PilF